MAKKKNNQRALLTIQDVGQVLRVTDATVRRWCQNGELPFAKLGHVIRVRPGDLEKFIEDSVDGREANQDG
jgi:excisionase family DNA binding protein